MHCFIHSQLYDDVPFYSLKYIFMPSAKMKFSIFPLYCLLWLTFGFPDHSNESTTEHDVDTNDDMST